MDSFGPDPLRPNVPIPYALKRADNDLGIAYGLTFSIYNPSRKEIIYQAVMSTNIVSVSSNAGRWILTLDRKQLVIIDRKDLSKHEIFHLPRRATSALMTGSGDEEDKVIFADKFGDVCVHSLESMRSLSRQTLMALRDHALKNPTDTSFAAINEVGLKAAAELVKQFENDDSQLTLPPNNDAEIRDFMVKDSLLGHLAILTHMQLESIEGKQYLITADKDEKIRLSEYPELHRCVSILCGHTQFITALTMIGDQYLVSSGADSTIRLWDARNGKELQMIEYQGDDEFPLILIEESVQRTSHIAVYFANSTKKMIYALNDEPKLVLTETLTLKAKPIACLEKWWLDLEGNLWENGSIVVDRNQLITKNEEKAFFQRHWKHTREEGAEDFESIVAKRPKRALKNQI